MKDYCRTPLCCNCALLHFQGTFQQSSEMICLVYVGQVSVEALAVSTSWKRLLGFTTKYQRGTAYLSYMGVRCACVVCGSVWCGTVLTNGVTPVSVKWIQCVTPCWLLQANSQINTIKGKVSSLSPSLALSLSGSPCIPVHSYLPPLTFEAIAAEVSL